MSVLGAAQYVGRVRNSYLDHLSGHVGYVYFISSLPPLVHALI